jgi:hypothetical protein
MMLAALNEVSEQPVLVPDVEAAAQEVHERRPDLPEFGADGPTQTFLVLRELISAGLVEHTLDGYRLTPEGTTLVERLRAKKPKQASEIRAAAEAAVA